MSMSRNCRSRLQRLRGWGDDTSQSSGSRGYAPGELCHLLPPCCSNPRRDWLCQTVRLCECMPWNVAGVKSAGSNSVSEISAKIAAFRRGASVFPKVRHSGDSRTLPQSCGKTPAFAGVTVWGRARHLSLASSRIQYLFHTAACWLEARTGTHPPFFSQGP